MWGEEAHLPAWPAGPANGVTARTLRAALRAVRRSLAEEPRYRGLSYNIWAGSLDQQRSGSS